MLTIGKRRSPGAFRNRRLGREYFIDHDPVDAVHFPTFDILVFVRRRRVGGGAVKGPDLPHPDGFARQTAVNDFLDLFGRRVHGLTVLLMDKRQRVRRLRRRPVRYATGYGRRTTV